MQVAEFSQERMLFRKNVKNSRERSWELSYVLYEHHPRVGDAWRCRYDSLVLFSPRAYSALPGLPLSGDPEGYPTKEEMANYLEHYAQTFRLPVYTAEGIVRLERLHTSFLAHTTRGRRVEASAVIVATGAMQQPIVPAFLSTGKLIRAALMTDEASLVDLVKFGQGNRFSLKHLWGEFSQVDLTRYQTFDVPIFFAFLFEHQLQEKFRYLYTWTEGDVLVWDHLGTIHRAVADYGPDEHRLMKRCQVMATKIFEPEFLQLVAREPVSV